MKEVHICDELLEYLTSDFSDLVKTTYEENANLFPYLDCTNSFFEKLHNEYGIKFNSNILDSELEAHIDDEIFTNLCPKNHKVSK